MVTLEAVVAPGADPDAARRAIKARLAERFGFDHATVETCAEGAAEARQLPCPGARAYLGAPDRSKARRPCRSRSPRPCPPTTCSGTRA